MRLFIGITACILTNVLNAQVWFDIGAKGGVGTGILINKTLSQDKRLETIPGLNTFYGGKLGINFGEKHAVAIDIVYSQNAFSFLQNGITGNENEVYKSSLRFSSLEIAPLYRLTKEASYLEIGPSFSLNRNAQLNDEFPFGPTINDADKYIRGTTTNVIFGFGGHIIGNEIISLMAGLRFSYTLNTIISDSYSDINFPFTNYSDIVSAGNVNSLRGQVVFELNFSLGYLVRSSCGKRVAFLTF